MSNFNKFINRLGFIGSSILVFTGSYFFITGEKRIARVLFIAAIVTYALSLFFNAYRTPISFNKIIKVKTFIGSLMSVCIGSYFFIMNEYKLASLFFIAAIVQYALSSFFKKREEIKEVKNNENDQL